MPKQRCIDDYMHATLHVRQRLQDAQTNAGYMAMRRRIRNLPKARATVDASTDANLGTAVRWALSFMPFRMPQTALAASGMPRREE